MSLIDRNYHFMLKHIQKVGQVLAFVPLMAIPSSQLALNIGQLPQTPVTKVEVSADEVRKEKADIIDSYFKERKMPLHGSGMTFVLVAEKYGLDYRLLPAIGIRESSGGKAACGYNAFGWGSCKLHNFNSYEEAIESLGRNLGGANANTSRYYAGKSTYDKLYHYNGTVLPTYPDEVLAIMKMIDINNN